jgi:hypothetical protein
MNTRNLSKVKGRQALKSDNLTAICELIVIENVGASTSHKPMASTACYSDSFARLFYNYEGLRIYSAGNRAVYVLLGTF